jgi:hypothetical protein
MPADAGAFKLKEAELSGEYDWKVAESPFLFLTTELPPPPLFKDEFNENIIPQVILILILVLFPFLVPFLILIRNLVLIIVILSSWAALLPFIIMSWPYIGVALQHPLQVQRRQ